jgi:hypothetical protein
MRQERAEQGSSNHQKPCTAQEAAAPGVRRPDRRMVLLVRLLLLQLLLAILPQTV